MSVRVLFILLVISLVFNVAVLIGFIKARAAQTPGANVTPPAQPAQPRQSVGMPEGKSWFDRVTRELKLDETQRASLSGLQQRQQQQNSVFGDSILVLRQELQEEVRKAEPDLERVRAMVDQEADLTRQRRLAEAELYGEFVNMLSEEQRQRLRERSGGSPRGDGRQGSPGQPQAGPPEGARNGQPRQQGPSPEILRKHDRNGNGRLDPDEAKEARRDLQSRRREIAPRVSQFPPLWPWFDRDGDGELNETERTALSEFFRIHRPAGAESIRPEQLMPPSQRDGRQEGRRRGDQNANANGEPREPTSQQGGPR